jgi:hypothetical protein
MSRGEAKLRGRVLARLAALAVTGIAGSCLYAPAADAATFCVAPKQSPECSETFAGVQAALDAANPYVSDVRQPDTILIGEGEFTGPFCYAADDPLTIVGEGPAETVLTGPARSCFPARPDLFSPAIVTLHNFYFYSQTSRINLFEVGVRIPAGSNSTALLLAGVSADDVEVSSDPGAVHPTGILTKGIDASFTSGSITLPGERSVGVRADARATVITRSRIAAVTGVLSKGTGTRDVTGTVFLPSGEVIITSSLVTITDALAGSGTPPVGLRVLGIPEDIPGAPGYLLLFARNVTVYGRGRDEDVGVALQSDAGTTGEAFVTSSILDNVGISLRRRGVGTASLATVSSSYLPQTSEGAISEARRVDGPPKFVSPATGDFRLEPESPLIDQGDDRGYQLPDGFSDSPLDLEGNPRLLDGTINPGDPGCEARRDVGAIEFAPSTLVARVSVAPDAIVGNPVEFDASGSCDPNPAASLSFEWSFDDGGIAGGARALHTFTTPGRHQATITVSSSDGRSASAVTSVEVAQPPTAGVDAPVRARAIPLGPADRKPPRVRRLDIRPNAFLAMGAGPSIARARGASVRYRLSEPARTRFTIERLAHRRTSGGRCRGVETSRRCRYFKSVRGSFTHRGQKGANKFRFSGRLRGKKLQPGAYRLIATPRDAAGNRGRSVRIRFHIGRL